MVAEVGPLDGILVLEVANWWALLPRAVQLHNPGSRAPHTFGWVALGTGMAVVPIQLNGYFCTMCRIAGPCCGALLADMGATVIKVEPPTGDSMRYVQRQPQDAAGNSQQVRTAPVQITARRHPNY